MTRTGGTEASRDRLAPPAGAVAPRAPHLGPDASIARLVTRRGRFRALDPTRPAELPSPAKVVGAVAWAALVFESVRRARRAERERPPERR